MLLELAHTLPQRDKMPSTVWIQFAKAPKLGAVKTRLAATTGQHFALEAHNTLTLSVNKQLTNLCEKHEVGACDVWLAIAGESDAVAAAGTFYSGKGATFDRLFEQPLGDLGVRMRTLLNDGLQLYDYAFVVGSDFPVLDKPYLNAAVCALADSDLVLGPTNDGGYGLIGVNGKRGENLMPDFGDVEWGTEKVFAQTKARLNALGLCYTELEKRFDVDDEKDWNAWLSSQWYVEPI